MNKKLVGNYKTKTALNIRKGAGFENEVLVIVSPGTIVSSNGESEMVSGNKWLHVAAVYGGKEYIGYAMADYLERERNVKDKEESTTEEQ